VNGSDDALRGQTCLVIARDRIARDLGLQAVPWSHASYLDEDAATFVTLLLDGELRGCIGSMEAHRPLHRDVSENAHAAAFRDSRFPPLRAAEWPDLSIEVSVLSPLEALPVGSRDALLRALRPGVDGLAIEWRDRRGTFLPQVWEDLTEPEDFLRHLERKARLPEGFWHAELRAFRYTAWKWREGE
jgi:hypothetical protein